VATPIGLTRAEEEREQERPPGPRVVVVAPPGAEKCRISVPPNGDDCPAAATGHIVWFGEEKQRTLACDDCARAMSLQAQSVHSSIRFVPFPRAPETPT
jgi:hypothetical protein